MNWKHRSVLVTGASGFLGGHLVSELADRGANAVALVRDGVWNVSWSHPRSKACKLKAIANGDVRDQKLLERVLGEYEIETVFHLAAQTCVGIANSNPVSTFETNVQGTLAVLEACRRSPRVKWIVVASTDKAYGEGVSDESAELRAKHPYDVSKMCADVVAQTYARRWGLPVVITRCANLFGGGDLNWSRLVPSTIRSVLGGERPVLRGSGREVRDWLHVSDAVAAYVACAEKVSDNNVSFGEAFNFSLGVQETTLEIVRLITQLAGVDVTPIIQGSATGEISKQGLICDKANRILGWKPKTGLADGLREAIGWYKQYA
jgi:CDP-glucose 4,6-dehydratase